MTRQYFRLLTFLLLLAGCTGLPFQFGSSPQAETLTPPVVLPTTAPASPEAPESTTPSTPAVTQAATQPTTGASVRIWLPPEFDPAGNSAASELLNSRLEEFLIENPDVRLEVRVKALSGEGGMLASLVATNESAPLALPDLVLLPRAQLEEAALNELLYAYDDLTDVMGERSWFGYAQQLARWQASIYGLPFAGDALVLAYRPASLESLPHNLDSFLTPTEVLLFPAADPQALFTLGIYLESGGSLQDEQGRPYLDEAILVSALEFEQRASLAGVMPFWLTQYSNDDQVWEAFLAGQAPMAVTWASTYIKNAPGAPEDVSMAPLPTRDGAPFTLADGWSWALAGQDPERRSLSTRLAEFLVEKEFVAAWSAAAGYLPPRVDALQEWQEADLRQAIEQISYSAHLVPPADLIANIGPALEQAVVAILKSESEPQAAAQAVIDQVSQP